MVKGVINPPPRTNAQNEKKHNMKHERTDRKMKVKKDYPTKSIIFDCHDFYHLYHKCDKQSLSC